jgi:hypothetical protein
MTDPRQQTAILSAEELAEIEERAESDATSNRPYDSRWSRSASADRFALLASHTALQARLAVGGLLRRLDSDIAREELRSQQLEMNDLRLQLREAQATIARLREALEEIEPHLLREGDPDWELRMIVRRIIERALATPDQEADGEQ